MAMIRVEPVEVRVRTGWFDGSPREITWGEERLQVTRLTAVREEAAAFPVITGPRTLFEVETPRRGAPRRSLTSAWGRSVAGRWFGGGAGAPVPHPPVPRSSTVRRRGPVRGRNLQSVHAR
jgi:hypothetical protein